MEQTLPLSESSTMPTRKLSVMRWVAFVLFLIGSLGSEFIFAFIIDPIEVIETRILTRSIGKFAELFFSIAFCLFIIYISSNRAVRNAMIIMGATDCLWLLFMILRSELPVDMGLELSGILILIIHFLSVYAYSIVILNTNLSSIKKGWITVLCLACINGIVSAVTSLFIWFPNLQEILGIPDNYRIYFSSCLCFSNPMYEVLSWGYTLFLVIAWYQIIFGEAFAYTGFKKDDDGVVYRYSFFNRYTVGMFISSAFVVSLICLLIAKVFTL